MHVAISIHNADMTTNIISNTGSLLWVSIPVSMGYVSSGNHYDLLPRVRMREGVKQLVLYVCQSSEKFRNLNIDRVKWFPKLTVALTL